MTKTPSCRCPNNHSTPFNEQCRLCRCNPNPNPLQATKMLSSLPPFSPSLHLPPLKSNSRSSSKSLILIPRFGPKFQIGVRPTVGSSGVITKLARFAALDDDRTIEEYGRLGEAEAILRDQPSGLDRNISWRNVESVLNGISKWLVAALYCLAILWKRDAEVLWAAIGSIINSWFSITLKRILNHERPVSGLRSDPGMPSSHAQSIFYVEAIAIFSMVHWLGGLNLLSMTIASLAIVFGSYLSWLRVSEQLHTLSQVLVGALFGSSFGITWCWLWHSFVLRTFISSIWVRVMVVLGSIAFCVTFMGYIIQHCLKDEL